MCVFWTHEPSAVNNCVYVCGIRCLGPRLDKVAPLLVNQWVAYPLIPGSGSGAVLGNTAIPDSFSVLDE